MLNKHLSIQLNQNVRKIPHPLRSLDESVKSPELADLETQPGSSQIKIFEAFQLSWFVVYRLNDKRVLLYIWAMTQDSNL